MPPRQQHARYPETGYTLCHLGRLSNGPEAEVSPYPFDSVVEVSGLPNGRSPPAGGRRQVRHAKAPGPCHSAVSRL